MNRFACCANCKAEGICKFLRRCTAKTDPEIRALAERAVEAQKNDKRTEEEKIRDGVSFICDTDFGEYE